MSVEELLENRHRKLMNFGSFLNKDNEKDEHTAPSAAKEVNAAIEKAL